MDTTQSQGSARLYGGTIAIVSGVYSLVVAGGGDGMMTSTSALLMSFLGLVVLCHGVVLLTPYASRLGEASGPLMIVYAVIMLLNQTLVAVTDSPDWGMGGGMSGGMGPSMAPGMGWDLGMVALAVLMLVSGALMVRE